MSDILTTGRCGTSSQPCPRCCRKFPYFIQHKNSEGGIEMIEMICEGCSSEFGPVKQLICGAPRISAIEMFEFYKKRLTV
jgi:hypothetical protein